jgi:serine/threonine protein kinase
LEGNWSAEFKEFIANCLAKDPKKRFSAVRLLKVRRPLPK